jgi:hypothetical protein
MNSSTEVAAVGIWFMLGGGVMALFGIVSAMLARTAGDRGGMASQVSFVGIAIFMLGAFLDYRWGNYW